MVHQTAGICLTLGLVVPEEPDLSSPAAEVQFDSNLFSSSDGVATGDIGVSPQNVTPVDVRQYVSYLTAVKRQKPASVARKVQVLKNFFDWLVGTGRLKTNPAAGVRLPRETRRPPKSLTDRELYQIRRAVYETDKPRDVAVLELLANTGLRVSELCSLELGDVVLSERKGKVAVRRKGNKYREVPLNVDLRKTVRQCLEIRPVFGSNKLILSERGPMTPSGVYRLLQKYVDAASVHVSPHMLRHTFATRLLREAGAHLVTVKEPLGHQDISTAAIYILNRGVEDMEDAALGFKRQIILRKSPSSTERQWC